MATAGLLDLIRLDSPWGREFSKSKYAISKSTTDLG